MEAAGSGSRLRVGSSEVGRMLRCSGNGDLLCWGPGSLECQPHSQTTKI